MAETRAAPHQRPGVGRILRNSLRAVRFGPSILGVFAVTGLLSALLPTFFSNIVQLVGVVVGVVISYEALGGSVTDEPTLRRRAGTALLTVFIAAIPIAVGLLLFVLPGLYLIARLWVAIPAVMIDGAGPFEALGTSWDAMENSIRTIIVFTAVVVFCGLLLLVPILTVVSVPIVATTLASMVVGSMITAGMAALYQQFSDSGVFDGTQNQSGA